jgi:DNA mismatch repair ATPase MutS
MFYSILFPTREQHDRRRYEIEPEYFKDLNLDQLFAPIVTEDHGLGGKKKMGAGLGSFFFTPLQDKNIIIYRQDVLRDLEDDELRTLLTRAVHKVNIIDDILDMIHDALKSPLKWRDNFLIRGHLLEFVEKFNQAVSALCEELSGRSLRSEGLRSFTEYLKAYLASKDFTDMCGQAAELRKQLSTVEYCMNIKFPTIRIRQYEGQADLGKDLLAVFSKFKTEDTDEYRRGVPDEPQDSRGEATVLNMVAAVYKDIFADLDTFFDQYNDFEYETILRFFREIQFYLSWLDLIAPLRQNGLKFCYPVMSADPSHLYCRDGFDIALAYAKRNRSDVIVTNDFELRAPERIIVITGPNQGGKTTFTRAFGQMHHLAALGLCVPGSEASLYLFDGIQTHFEREEDLTSLSGKLQDDLMRLRDLLDKATPRSIVLVNEIFGSTTFKDALALGRRMMATLTKLEAPAIVVTFLDALATYGPETVSMMSTVSEEDPSRRTYKIVRKPPDGLAYAMYLAKKHRLAYTQATGRLAK